VAVGKALHLLAPRFFPLWDDRISKGYGCYYGFGRAPDAQYFRFCRVTAEVAGKVGGYGVCPQESLLKAIDMYNYSKYTRGWI